MATQATPEPSSSLPDKQEQPVPGQKETVEAFIKQLEKAGYKVSREYTPDEQLARISGESLKKTWLDYLQLFAIPLVLLIIGSWFRPLSINGTKNNAKEIILMM